MSEAILRESFTSAEVVDSALRNLEFQITMWEGRKCSIPLNNQTITVNFKTIIQFLEQNFNLVTQASKDRLLELNKVTDEEIFKKQAVSICKKIFLMIALFFARLFGNGSCTKSDYHSRITHLNVFPVLSHDVAEALKTLAEKDRNPDLPPLVPLITPPVFTDDLPVRGVAPLPEPEKNEDPEVPLTAYEIRCAENNRREDYEHRLKSLQFLNDPVNRQDPKRIIDKFVTLVINKNEKSSDKWWSRHEDLKRWLAGQNEGFIEQLLQEIKQQLNSSENRHDLLYELCKWTRHTKDKQPVANKQFEDAIAKLTSAKIEDADFMGDLLADDEVGSWGWLHFLSPAHYSTHLKAILNSFMTNLKGKHAGKDNVTAIINDKIIKLARNPPEEFIMETVEAVLEITNQTWEQLKNTCETLIMRGGKRFPHTFWAYRVLTLMRTNPTEWLDPASVGIDPKRVSVEFAGDALGLLCKSDECAKIITFMIGYFERSVKPIFADFVNGVVYTEDREKIKNTFEVVWPFVGDFHSLRFEVPKFFRTIRNLQNLETVIEALSDVKRWHKPGFLPICVSALFKSKTETTLIGRYPLNHTDRPLIPLADRIELMRFRPDLCRQVERFTPVKDLFDKSLNMGAETAQRNLHTAFAALDPVLPVPSLAVIVLSYLALVTEKHLPEKSKV